METVTFPDSRVRAYLNEHFVPVLLDWEEHPALFSKFGLGAIPASVVRDPGQVPRAAQEGSLAPAAFLDWLVQAKVAGLASGEPGTEDGEVSDREYEPADPEASP